MIKNINELINNLNHDNSSTRLNSLSQLIEMAKSEYMMSCLLVGM